MRTLFLVHRIPYPPNKGDKIRSYHLLVHLARRGEVDLVTHVDDPRDLRHRQLLADICRRVEVFPLSPFVGRGRALLALIGGHPLSVAYMTRSAARRRVRELLATERYDLVVGFSSQVAAYLPPDLEVPLLMDLVDVDSEKFAAYAAKRPGLRGLVDRVEARRLRRHEAELGARAARVVVTTPREAELYRDKVGTGRVVAIGNGVVIPDVVPDAARRTAPLCVFVGAMDYEANVEAAEIGARKILPLIRASHPEAVFRIVGRNPSPRVTALAALPGVEVTGEVTDLRPHLDAAALALVPLRVARGVQNKVLEALAHGLPVVSSLEVLRSLAEGAEKAVFAAGDADGMAEKAIRLLGNPGERERAGVAARAYVRSHHDWRLFDAAWDRLIAEVSSAAPAGARG